mmetsp:Transcript_717/g.2099  ORF Transcript_717/g.2099 Transcript_717/m.2099 type:complete len:85 (-) Transcript_717:12-266(-)
MRARKDLEALSQSRRPKEVSLIFPGALHGARRRPACTLCWCSWSGGRGATTRHSYLAGSDGADTVRSVGWGCYNVGTSHAGGHL